MRKKPSLYLLKLECLEVTWLVKAINKCVLMILDCLSSKLGQILLFNDNNIPNWFISIMVMLQLARLDIMFSFFYAESAFMD